MNVLTTFYQEGYHIDTPENFENIINSINTQDIQHFTKMLLKDAASYEIVFSPLN